MSSKQMEIGNVWKFAVSRPEKLLLLKEAMLT